MKQFDEFSFKAKQSQSQSSSVRSKQDQSINLPVQSQISIKQPQKQQKPIKWNEITYRFDHNPSPAKFNFNNSSSYNLKIQNIEQQLQDNIRRRMQLQSQLSSIREKNKQQTIDKFYQINGIKNEEQQTKSYVDMEKKAKKIEELIVEHPPVQNYSKIFIKTQKPRIKKQPKLTINQLSLAKIWKKIKFPELPEENLQTLEKEAIKMYSHGGHADINYILMVIYFHMGQYQKVRQHYREILLYQSFQERAYWVAAEAEFALNNYSLCIKLAEKCMQRLPQTYLARFIYLQARSYEGVGNYLNSIVCYNQLIKIRGKVPEYYLQRGIIYDRIGYLKQAKQDFLMFGTLKPEASTYLKQKILSTNDEFKRKELLGALRKIN